MEPVSLGLGIVALGGVFENAMTCFTCVRMAKSFNSDLQTFTLRLKLLHLRLSRWGKVVGIGVDVDNLRNIEDVNLDTQHIALATDLLKQMGNLFETVQKAEQGLIDTADNNDLGHLKPVVEKFSSMTIQHKPSIMKKAKWVLYVKDEMCKLLDDLEKLISGLYDFIPAQTDTIRKICNEEADQLLDQGRLHVSALSLLEELAAALDTKLAEAIAQQKKQQAAASTTNNYNHGKAINVGNVYGGQTNHVNF